MKKILLILSLLFTSVYNFSGNNVYLIIQQNLSSKNLEVTTDYSVYSEFKYILTDKKYHCYGKPCNYYKSKICSLCGTKYYYQKFCNGSTTTTIYSNTNCKKSNTGKHDKLKLKTIEPCGCDDDFNIGRDW